MKKCTDGPESERLIEKSPVEKSSVNGVDALLKNKEIQGVGQTRHNGVNTRTKMSGNMRPTWPFLS
jgi:hypothetical protein